MLTEWSGEALSLGPESLTVLMDEWWGEWCNETTNIQSANSQLLYVLAWNTSTEPIKGLFHHGHESNFRLNHNYVGSSVFWFDSQAKRAYQCHLTGHIQIIMFKILKRLDIACYFSFCIIRDPTLEIE